MLTAQSKSLRRKTLDPSSVSGGKNGASSPNDENVQNSSNSPIKRKRAQSASSKSSFLASYDLSFANQNEMPLSSKKSTKKRKSSVASEVSSLLFADSEDVAVQNDRRQTFEGNISGLLNDSTISGPSAAPTETSDLLTFSFVEGPSETEVVTHNRRETINPSDISDIIGSLSHNTSTVSSNINKSVSIDMGSAKKTPRNSRRDTADQADLLDLLGSLEDEENNEESTVESSAINKSVLSAKSPTVESAKSSAQKSVGRRSSRSSVKSSAASSSLFSPSPKAATVSEVEDQVSVSSTPRRSSRLSAASSHNSSLMVSETNTSGYSAGSLLFEFNTANNNNNQPAERRMTADLNGLEDLLGDLTDDHTDSLDDGTHSIDVSKTSAPLSESLEASAVAAAEVDVSAGSINTMALRDNVSDLLNISLQSASAHESSHIDDDDNRSEAYSEISQNSTGSLRRSQRGRKSVGSAASVSTKGSKASNGKNSRRVSGVSEKSLVSGSSKASKKSTKASAAPTARLTAEALSLNATVNPAELTSLSDTLHTADPLSGFEDGFSERTDNRDSICTIDLMNEVDNLLPDEPADNETVAASQLSLDSSSFGFGATEDLTLDGRRMTVEAGQLDAIMDELEQSELMKSANEVTESAEGVSENPLEESMLTDNGTVDARGLDVSSDTIQSMATLDTYALMEDVGEALEQDVSNNDTSALTFVTMESLGGILDRLEEAEETASRSASSPAVGSSKSSAFDSPLFSPVGAKNTSSSGHSASGSHRSSRSPAKTSSSGKKKKIPRLVVNGTGSASKSSKPALDFDEVTSSFTATSTLNSTLKSCMSALKPPRGGAIPQSATKKTVVFGSPDAAEFYKGSPTSHITPMHKSVTKSLYSMEGASHFASIDPENFDQETQDNSEELEMWDRLSNASGGGEGSSDDESVMAEVQEKALRSRRLSKLQPHLQEFSVDSTHTPANDVSVSAFSDCTNTVALPANLADLLDQNDVLRSPLIPIKRTAENSPQVARSAVCVPAGSMFDSREVSMEDHTEEIGDLGTLLREYEDLDEDGDAPALNEMSRIGGVSSRDSSGLMDRSDAGEDDNTLSYMLGLPNRRDSLGSSGKSKKRSSFDGRRDSFELPEDPVELINSVIHHSKDFSMDEENTMDMLARHQNNLNDISSDAEDETRRLDTNLPELMAQLDESGRRSTRSNSRRGSRSFVVDDEVSVRQDGGLVVDQSNMSDAVFTENGEEEEADIDLTEEIDEGDVSNATTLMDENSLHNLSALVSQQEELPVNQSLERSRMVHSNNLLNRLQMLNAGARTNALSQCNTPANPRMSLGFKRIANNISLQSAKKSKLNTPVAAPADKDDSLVIVGPFSAQKQQLSDALNVSTVSSVNDTQDTIALPQLDGSFSASAAAAPADVSVVLNQSSVVDTEIWRGALRTNIAVYFTTVQRLKDILSKKSQEVQQTVMGLLKNVLENRTHLRTSLSTQLSFEQLHGAWDTPLDADQFADALVCGAKRETDTGLSFSSELSDWVKLSVKAILQQTSELEKNNDANGVNKVVFKALNKELPQRGSFSQDRTKGSVVAVQKSVVYNKKLQHIVNRLTYCRLVTFQSHLIHIDVLLSPTVSVPLKFTLSKSEGGLHIDNILVDLIVHSQHPSNRQVQDYFATVLCGHEGPIGQVDNILTPAQIPALLQKISCYVAKLRLSL